MTRSNFHYSNNWGLLPEIGRQISQPLNALLRMDARKRHGVQNMIRKR